MDLLFRIVSALHTKTIGASFFSQLKKVVVTAEESAYAREVENIIKNGKLFSPGDLRRPYMK